MIMIIYYLNYRSSNQLLQKNIFIELVLKGFIKGFNTVVRQNIKHLKTVLDLDIPVIGIEPSMTLTYRDEYDKIARNENIFNKVQLIQEFLVKQDKRLP